jgi:hypothetical protein
MIGILPTYTTVPPLLLPVTGRLGKGASQGLRGRQCGQSRRGLIGHPESTTVELVMQQEVQLLFLPNGFLSPRVPAGCQHLCPSSVLLTVLFAGKVG